jgi:hypothetical protein
MSNEPTFHRCPHDKEHPFSMISNELIRNKILSPQARWLLIYLLSNREGFALTMQKIQDTQNIGRHALRTIYKECEKAGYIKRIVIKGENNLLKTVFHFSETPKFKENSPTSDFPPADGRPVDESAAKEDHVKKTRYNKPTPPLTPPNPRREKSKDKLVGGVGSLQELEKEFGSYILEEAQREYKIAYDKSVLKGKPIKNQVKYFRTICERLNNQTLEELVLPENKEDYEKNHSAALNGEKAYMSGKTILGYSLEARDTHVRFIMPDKHEDISYNMNHILFMLKCKPYINKLWS